MSPALQGNLVCMVTGGAFGPMPGGSGQIGPGPSLHHVDRVAQEHCVLGLRHPGACQGDAPRPGGCVLRPDFGWYLPGLHRCPAVCVCVTMGRTFQMCRSLQPSSPPPSPVFLLFCPKAGTRSQRPGLTPKRVRLVLGGDSVTSCVAVLIVHPGSHCPERAGLL